MFSIVQKTEFLVLDVCTLKELMNDVCDELARTPVEYCPLQDLEVPVRPSHGARLFVPGAPLGPRPLQDREMPALGSVCASCFVPAAPLGPRPLEDREVPVLCSPCARPFVPGEALGPRSLQHIQTPALSGVFADAPPELI